ncbi:chromatin modification- protein VID21 [Dermatophagoides pteronyssinus]|uniref:Chromatin modification- protein VID21 n=2 Tax=Dermatophagoides pteronyssinus TaxID=6956 RepID=A0ABQ8IX96_DERPT|nr:ell-associated factor Eaf-like [Dermatophagoides pteronyssinus]KAH9414822.1 chromatin modification- protein VID21 [Dermatophagoides pteronyssinus]
MSALADFSHKFGSQPRELKIGQSFFTDDANTVFHTIRYDFVPASIDPNKTSSMDFGENGKVTISMPNVEGSGTTESVYQGQRKPHQKECVLIINNETGDITLERLNQSMIVKKARLRQEDRIGKSLVLNSKQTTGTLSTANNNMNGNSSSSNITQVNKSNNMMNSDKKLMHKNSIANGHQQNSAKKTSPSLSNGSSNSTSSSVRSNGISANNNKINNSTISPPSMPVFNTNNNTKLVNKNSHHQNDNNNLDWKIKMPDPPDVIKSKSNYSTNKKATNNCLSELSFSESSDSDGESSSDHFSDNDDGKTNKKVNTLSSTKSGLSSSSSSSSLSINSVGQQQRSTAAPAAPSMPSFVATLSTPIFNGCSIDVINDTKKNTATATSGSKALTLSEDSDSSSDDNDNDGGKNKKSFKKISMKRTATSSNNDILLVDNSKANNNSVFNSMPKLSQLSQDLQLSESDSDD